METDYRAFTYLDLITLEDVEVRVDMPCTYLLVESKDNLFRICGNLTYLTEMRGNNLIIKFLGSLKVCFFDMEGFD